MRGIFATYSIVSKTAWLLIALSLIVFCGPVKRLIELKQGNVSLASTLSFDNKLKTGYREKNDLAQPVQQSLQTSRNSGLALFTICTCMFLLSGVTQELHYKIHPQHRSALATLP